MKKKTLQDCLKYYFPYAKAIYVQWLVFGTSGVQLAENEPLLAQLTFCAPKSHAWNCVGKSIVRPEYVVIENIWSPHHVPLKSSCHYKNGSGQKMKMVDGDLYALSHQADYMRINHYFFRDEKFYREVKIPRKLKRGMSLDEMADLYEACFQAQDYKILELVN